MLSGSTPSIAEAAANGRPPALGVTGFVFGQTQAPAPPQIKVVKRVELVIVWMPGPNGDALTVSIGCGLFRITKNIVYGSLVPRVERSIIDTAVECHAEHTRVASAETPNWFTPIDVPADLFSTAENESVRRISIKSHAMPMEAFWATVASIIVSMKSQVDVETGTGCAEKIEFRNCRAIMNAVWRTAAEGLYFDLGKAHSIVIPVDI